MSPSSSTSLARRLAASMSLAGVACGLGWFAFGDLFRSYLMMGLAGLAGVASFALARRRVLPQVFARGTAWLVLLPFLARTVSALGQERLPQGIDAFLTVASCAALLLANPGLHTDAANAEFSPVAQRRVFLAGATASFATGIAAAASAIGLWAWGDGAAGALMGTLAAALLASAVGVVRMRAWGVLLAMVVGVASVVVALFSSAGPAMLPFALPGALFAFPLFAARWRERGAAPLRIVASRARVQAGSASLADVVGPRVRVRVSPIEEVDDEERAAPALRAVAE